MRRNRCGGEVAPVVVALDFHGILLWAGPSRPPRSRGGLDGLMGGYDFAFAVVVNPPWVATRCSHAHATQRSKSPNQETSCGGAGLSVYHDSRDLQDAPKRGWVLNFNNVAYRQAIEGSNNFDTYRADYRGFWSHGDGHVFAVRQSNQWTVDAPPSAYAPVLLRGYTMGEFLGKNMSSIEAEERHRLAERWTATAFAGVACLYGGGKSCSQGTNAFPSVGAGVQYVLKPQQGIVANLELAVGKDGNRALLFKMGYGW